MNNLVSRKIIYHRLLHTDPFDPVASQLCEISLLDAPAGETHQLSAPQQQ